MSFLQVFVVFGIISMASMASGEGCPAGKFGWQCRYDCFCDGPCDNVTGHCENCSGTRWGPGCLLNSSCMYHDDKGKQYQGRLSVGNDGRSCVQWYPQIYNYGSDRFPDGDLKKASNYCRNPRADGNQYASGPWCYHIRPPPTNWTYCTVSSCSCPQGRFGVNCRSECHCSDSVNTCVSASGECQSGRCHAHFQGVNCQKCVDGRFSVHCDKVCHCEDRSEACDKNTGHCASGCATGWSGQDCQTACMNGTFGKNCVNRCRCLNPTEVCDKANGSCTKSGCAAGWHGPGCQTECVQERYGPNCESNCSDSCQEPGSCNRTSGFCACQAGYEPPTCHTECAEGRYGSNCVGICSAHCKEPGHCNKTSGACTCQSGFKPPTCHDRCEAGRYGENCKYTCSSGCNNTCDMLNGVCSCLPGYKGPTCYQMCSDGKFGHNCSYSCNCHNRMEVCVKTTGICEITGCRPGWHGQGCQTAFTYHSGASVAWGVAGLFAVLFIASLISQVIVLWKCMNRKTERQETKTRDVTKTSEIYHNIEDIELADEQNTKYESVMPTATSNQGIPEYERLRFDRESGNRK